MDKPREYDAFVKGEKDIPINHIVATCNYWGYVDALERVRSSKYCKRLAVELIADFLDEIEWYHVARLFREAME